MEYQPKQAVKSVSNEMNIAVPVTPFINPCTKPSRSLTVFFATLIKSFILYASLLFRVGYLSYVFILRVSVYYNRDNGEKF